MSWKYLKSFSSVGCYTTFGASLYFFLKEETLKIVENSSKSPQKNELSKFDLNWDHRAEYSLVKPLKENESSKKQKLYSEKLEKYRSKAVRHIVLIRHGQYYLMHDATDKERVLTQLGREQAKKTGERLKELDVKITDAVVSTMTRAKETANILLQQLPESNKIALKEDSMLEEGAPIGPEPKVGTWRPMAYFFVDGARIEAAFRKYFHRAEPEQEKDSLTLIVCHANVIRYFVCRAMQWPPEAWLRFSLHHASITWITIFPNGEVVMKMYGDCGHMPKSHVTTMNVDS